MTTTAKSPEETRVYRCRKCGNDSHFIGYDGTAYPGADCECGAYDEGEECTCLVTLRQPFYITETNDEGEAEDIYYDAHDGGPDSEIGSYQQIDCGQCGATIWKEAGTVGQLIEIEEGDEEPDPEADSEVLDEAE